jgi:transposase
VVGDKSYSYDRIRRYLARRGIAVVIPLRSDQGRDPDFDRESYCQRNKVERLIGHLKQWRRIATRYEKRAETYLAMLTLASIVLWL